MRLTKDQTVSVSLSAIVSLITVGAVVWAGAKPLVTKAVAGEIKDEMRQEIKSTVQSEVEPIKVAQTVLLEQQVLQTQKMIAQLERLRAADPTQWTAQQANDLVDLRSQLEAQQSALFALSR
jgi:hypothetical protein